MVRFQRRANGMMATGAEGRRNREAVKCRVSTLSTMDDGETV